ncbi:MAG: hypothetical protein Q9199_004810 [Rusavskia elegans]
MPAKPTKDDPKPPEVKWADRPQLSTILLGHVEDSYHLRIGIGSSWDNSCLSVRRGIVGEAISVRDSDKLVGAPPQTPID